MSTSTSTPAPVRRTDRPDRSPADARPSADLTGGPRPLPPLSPVGLATVLVGTLLPMVDFFIVNVALPTMGRDLHASAETLELVVSGYAVVYAVLLVLGGRLGDGLGRRRLFLVGMTAFTVASLLCGLAPTAGTLVVARLLQGAAAALMVPQTLSTIQATGDASSRARALGWFGATGGIAAVTGQVLGGVLVGADLWGTGWRPIFLVNVPIGVAGLVLGARYVPETRSARRLRLDGWGTALMGWAVTALLVPLTEGRAQGWPAWSLLLLATAPLAAAAFVGVERAHERAGRQPLVPPSLVAMPSMRRGLVLAATFFGGFGAFMFVYALVTQLALRFDALRAGLTLAPMAAAFLVTSLLSPGLLTRFGPRVLVVGAAGQGIGLVVLGLTLVFGWAGLDMLELAPGLLVMGAGQGLVMSPLVRVVLSHVPVESAGAGSGVMATTQQVALALGVASLGSLFVALSPVDRLGFQGATLLVLAVQLLAAAVVALGARRLPTQ